MNSQCVDVLRHVLWTTVTGGWLYDPRQRPLVNVIQLYFWTLLLLCPLLLAVYRAESRLLWLAYSIGILLLFAAIKYATYALHRMFDTSESVTDGETREVHAESVEMAVLGREPQQSAAALTSASSSSSSSLAASPAGRIDHRADVHRSSVSTGPCGQYMAVSVNCSVEAQSDSALTPGHVTTEVSDRETAGDDVESVPPVSVSNPGPPIAAMFDLPALFSAMCERVHNNLTPAGFRRTLSFSGSITGDGASAAVGRGGFTGTRRGIAPAHSVPPIHLLSDCPVSCSARMAVRDASVSASDEAAALECAEYVDDNDADVLDDAVDGLMSSRLLLGASDDVSAINVLINRDASCSDGASVRTGGSGAAEHAHPSLGGATGSRYNSSASVASVPATAGMSSAAALAERRTDDDDDAAPGRTVNTCRRRRIAARRVHRPFIPSSSQTDADGAISTSPVTATDVILATTGDEDVSVCTADEEGASAAAAGVEGNADDASAQSQSDTVANTASALRHTHLACTHEDTSSGAVHYFQDELGNWLSYTFSVADTAAITTDASHTPRQPSSSPHQHSSSSLQHSLSAVGAVPTRSTTELQTVSAAEPPTATTNIAAAAAVLPPTECAAVLPPGVGVAAAAPWWLPGAARFDRLWLLSLFDRSVLVSENVLCVSLAALCAALAAALLHAAIFRDLSLLFFVLSLASSQFCLVKSVQPDAASPTHGHNRVVIYSRAFYFCLLCSIALLSHSLLGGEVSSGRAGQCLWLYGVCFSRASVSSLALRASSALLLALPLLFVLGLLPQPDTFVHYLLEQVDRHVAGGTAATSLPAAIYSVSRSAVAIAFLYMFAYGGLRENGVEAPTAQHIAYSLFCGLTVALCYHLSRCASEPLHLWRVLRRLCGSFGDRVSKNTTASITAEADDGSEKESSRGEEEGVPPAPPLPLCSSATLERYSVTSADTSDPLPEAMYSAVLTRLKSDALVCLIIGVLSFAVHCSTAFTALDPTVQHALWSLTAGCGLLLHYLLPQLRKQLPWLCVSRPLLRSAEYQQYEVSAPARLMWFECVQMWAVYIERHVLFPLVFLGALTTEPPQLVAKFGLGWAAFIVVVCAVKGLRTAYTDPGSSYLALVFTVLLFHFDFDVSETFLVDYCVVLVLHDKLSELLLKLQFVATYIAPWQITWGSAFHAFAQPFSVPHAALLLVQMMVSALLSSPLNPFLGSAVFLLSHVRPVRFWERDYSTRRVDHSNTRLSLHLDRSPGANDNNLNSIFYEHLSRSLQRALCGDILLGRWGEVRQGDCFVLASDYLNCLVHIIELGNGLVTFQVRGLEFRGTYCQRREVEAILEGVDDDGGCCCCEPGHVPHLLSANQIFNQRWLAWQVVGAKYVLEGYSISDYSAASMLQVFDLRKVLVAYYVKSVIFYTVRAASLARWLQPGPIMTHLLDHVALPSFVDVDPIFSVSVDEDYDFRASGITVTSFCGVYLDWIKHCVEQLDSDTPRPECHRNSPLVLLCLALSLMARRALCVASHHSHASVDFFLYGLHALFKGDFRITCLRDEWVFCDMDLLRRVVAPAVRMSIKLHQDHFLSPDDYEQPACLYRAIDYHDRHLVIAHEGDPGWRSAVLSGAPALLSLRHIVDDGADQYKVIMLNKRHLSFRLVQLNRECVRALWSGQQQELIYLRNRDPERGSIQNAKQALRNIISSSCDQPIGYPIYVSPLLTSYAETSSQLRHVLGAPLSWQLVREQLVLAWQRLSIRCGQGCASSGSRHGCDDHIAAYHHHQQCPLHGESSVRSAGTFPAAAPGLARVGKCGSSSLPAMARSSSCRCSSVSSAALPGHGGVVTVTSPATAQHTPPPPAPPPTILPPEHAHLLRTPSAGRDLSPAPVLGVGTRVRVVCGDLVYDTMNTGRRCDLLWPCCAWRRCGGKDSWGHWLPDGRCGTVVHYWSPGHPTPVHRSNLAKVILLLEMEGRYVPVAEAGCEAVLEDEEEVDDASEATESDHEHASPLQQQSDVTESQTEQELTKHDQADSNTDPL